MQNMNSENWRLRKSFSYNPGEKGKVVSHSVVSDFKFSRFLCPWDSPGKRSGLSFPSPGDLSKPSDPTLQADSLLPESPGKPYIPDKMKHLRTLGKKPQLSCRSLGRNCQI